MTWTIYRLWVFAIAGAFLLLIKPSATKSILGFPWVIALASIAIYLRRRERRAERTS